MGASADAEMSADEAAGLLAGIENVEERLTARTAGLTWIVWGMAIPGLFATYAAVEPLLAPTGDLQWILSFLWIPWIVAGSLATNGLWATNAVTLDREPARGSWWTSVGFAGLFFVLAGGVWALATLFDAPLVADALWIVASGLLTMAIGLLFRRRGAPGSGLAVVGGLVIVAGGLGVGAMEPTSPGVVNLAGAGLVGVVYNALGVWLYLRG